MYKENLYFWKYINFITYYMHKGLQKYINFKTYYMHKGLHQFERGIAILQFNE